MFECSISLGAVVVVQDRIMYLVRLWTRLKSCLGEPATNVIRSLP